MTTRLGYLPRMAGCLGLAAICLPVAMMGDSQGQATGYAGLLIAFGLMFMPSLRSKAPTKTVVRRSNALDSGWARPAPNRSARSLYRIREEHRL